MRPRRPNYDAAEVQTLVENYATLRELTGTTRRGLWVLVRLADLALAYQQLSRDLRRVVLLHGLVGLPQDATAELLQTSQRQVSKQYRWGLEEIVSHMNGGIL